MRTKKTPLSSDSRRPENSLRLDRLERGKSKRKYSTEGNPKGKSGKSEGKGKGKQSQGKDKRSEKGGKGEKKEKSESECSIGKGKKSKSESPSFHINCEDFDFLGLSSTPLSIDDASELEDCGPNVLEQAHSLPELSTFVQLVAMAGLTCMFHCGGPFTLLAPTNAAFEILNPEAMLELLRPENQVFLQELIVDHVLPGFHLSRDVTQSSIDTLLGESIQVAPDPLTFGDSIVQTPDIIGCNGVLHIVGAVLIPSGGTFGTSVSQRENSPRLDSPETQPPFIGDQTTAFPTPNRQPDAPIATPTDVVQTNVPTIRPVEVPVAPPMSAPVDSPVSLPVAPPTIPPADPPVSPPVAVPPVDPPVTPPVRPLVTPPVAPPIAPPSETPTAAPIDPPVAPPVAAQAPTETPTAEIGTQSPTISPFLRIVVDDLFLALVAPSASASPRRSEFETLAQLTTTYFDEYLRAFFADDPDLEFVRVESKLRLAKYG